MKVKFGEPVKAQCEKILGRVGGMRLAWRSKGLGFGRAWRREEAKYGIDQRRGPQTTLN